MQPCTFRVEYTLDNIPGREFGSVFIGPQNENVGTSVVAAGWAKVRLSHFLDMCLLGLLLLHAYIARQSLLRSYANFLAVDLAALAVSCCCAKC